MIKKYINWAIFVVLTAKWVFNGLFKKMDLNFRIVWLERPWCINLAVLTTLRSYSNGWNIRGVLASKWKQRVIEMRRGMSLYVTFWTIFALKTFPKHNCPNWIPVGASDMAETTSNISARGIMSDGFFFLVFLFPWDLSGFIFRDITLLWWVNWVEKRIYRSFIEFFRVSFFFSFRLPLRKRWTA